jgi:hypothetical protein
VGGFENPPLRNVRINKAVMVFARSGTEISGVLIEFELVLGEEL